MKSNQRLSQNWSNHLFDAFWNLLNDRKRYPKMTQANTQTCHPGALTRVKASHSPAPSGDLVTVLKWPCSGWHVSLHIKWQRYLQRSADVSLASEPFRLSVHNWTETHLIISVWRSWSSAGHKSLWGMAITCDGTDTYGCEVGFVLIWRTVSERSTITIDCNYIWTFKVHNARMGLNKSNKYYYIYFKGQGKDRAQPNDPFNDPFPHAKGSNWS